MKRGAKKGQTVNGEFVPCLNSKYETRFNAMATKACLLGATNEDLSDLFTVHIDTIYEWLKTIEKFSDAVKKGRELADQKVAASLYKRANGYKYEEVTYEEGTKKKVVIKEVVPDTVAQIFWLKNRQPKKWKDKQVVEQEGIQNVNITVTKEEKKAIQDDLDKRY